MTKKIYTQEDYWIPVENFDLNTTVFTVETISAEPGYPNIFFPYVVFANAVEAVKFVHAMICHFKSAPNSFSFWQITGAKITQTTLAEIPDDEIRIRFAEDAYTSYTCNRWLPKLANYRGQKYLDKLAADKTVTIPL